MREWRGRWYDRRTRLLLSQIAAALVIAGVAGFIVHTTRSHLAERNMSSGFGFLGDPAGFVIGEALIPFDAQDSYLRAMAVCGLNTLLVSLLSCIAATAIGGVIGVARLATNPLVRRLAALYVMLFRNTPLLLQMILWYALLQALPPVRQAISVGAAVFLSQRGLRLPSVDLHEPLRPDPHCAVGAVVVGGATADGVAAAGAGCTAAGRDRGGGDDRPIR